MFFVFLSLFFFCYQDDGTSPLQLLHPFMLLVWFCPDGKLSFSDALRKTLPF